jgi:DNA modification methylase
MISSALPSTTRVPLSQLKPAEWNPRTIKDERFRNLCESIEKVPEFLESRPVLAQADGTIYAGNMRFRAAQHLGMKTVPAIIHDIPDRLARERALRDNAQWGEFEDDELARLLSELGEAGSDLEHLGFDETELQQLLDRIGDDDGVDPDDIPALPETSRACRGDIWQLGQHRVMCGDATDAQAMAALMGNSAASCYWTDAPFGVNYVGRTADHLTIANDRPDLTESLLAGAFAVADRFLAAGSALYVMHPAGPQILAFLQAFRNQGWEMRQTLVWVKDVFVLGRAGYHYQHEPILFGCKPRSARSHGRRWYGGNRQSSVFQVPRPRSNDEHPTSKPVALVEAMLRNSTRSGEIVLDSFLGSGSTLVAAGRLRRRCFGMEIDPNYVDVAIERWERLTGERAERVRDAT